MQWRPTGFSSEDMQDPPKNNDGQILRSSTFELKMPQNDAKSIDGSYYIDIGLCFKISKETEVNQADKKTMFKCYDGQVIFFNSQSHKVIKSFLPPKPQIDGNIPKFSHSDTISIVNVIAILDSLDASFFQLQYNNGQQTMVNNLPKVHKEFQKKVSSIIQDIGKRISSIPKEDCKILLLSSAESYLDASRVFLFDLKGDSVNVKLSILHKYQFGNDMDETPTSIILKCARQKRNLIAEQVGIENKEN
jgi:hypothetical protein